MMNIIRLKYAKVFLGIILATGFFISSGHSASEVRLSKGQTVYVPIYSHIYSGVKARPFNLTGVLSIRNTDMGSPITVVSVDYYDTDGTHLQNYLKEPLQLKALQSTRYIVQESDKSGGSGANFIVKWESKQKVNVPIVEAVMIGTQSGRGLSFLSPGRVIKEKPE